MSSLENPQYHQQVLRQHQPTVAFLQSQSSIRIQGQYSQDIYLINGGSAASSFLQQQLPPPSRQLKPLPKESAQWQNKSVANPLDANASQNSTQVSAAPISASAGLGSSILSGSNQYHSQPLTGRSPIVGTRLGKFIIASRPGAGRSNPYQSPLLAYESGLVEDFELMKNVQNLIEDNIYRCQGSAIPSDNNLFADQPEGLPFARRQISLQNSGMKVKNEIELLNQNQHQRYSSACPEQKNEYTNNMFYQAPPQKLKDTLTNRYVDTLGKLMRVSQDGQQDRNGQLRKPEEKSYIEIQEQLKQAGVFDLVDPNTGLRLVDAQGLMTLQRQKYVKSMQRHNKINFQKKNPAALYFQIAKQKAKQNLENPKEDSLQLIGNQFQPKIITESLYQNLDQRRASNDIDQKELLMLFKRRHFDIVSLRRNKHNDTSPLNDCSMDDSLLKDGDLTSATDQTLKDIRNSIRFENLEDSRQPQVGLQKSERLFHSNIRQRRFITQGNNQSSTTRKGARDILINLKQQNSIANSSRAKLNGMIDASQSLQSQLEQIDEQKMRPPQPIVQFRKNYIVNNIQIESEEEKMERIIKLQKQIKAKYNDISLNQNLKEESYRFIILRGNNSELIKRCLEDRSGDWQEISSTNTLFNFKWAPVSRGIRFDYLSGHGMKKMVNHFEGHDQITEKDNLYVNMLRHYESQKKNVFTNLPITFTLDCGSTTYFVELERFQLYFAILERHKGEPIEERLALINKEISGHHLYPSSKKSQAKYTLCQNMFDGNNLWLLKPTDFNRGRGVQVFNSFEQFKRLINDYQQGVEVKFNNTPNDNKQGKKTINGQNDQPVNHSDVIPNIVKTNNFVIQKYLERPLLLKKRKFDIRLWVLVAHEGKCFLFKEGYIRTSSFEYDTSPDSLDKPFIHLTNNAVQRFGDNYGAFEEGNQLSLKQGSQLLLEDGIQCDINEMVEGQIQEIIKETLKSVEPRLNQNNRKYCFEIFGYDFIIDQQLNPWLIEVNTNPCLEESSGLLKVLIPRMVDDALKLTLDVIFPLKKGKKDCLSPTTEALKNTEQPEFKTKYSVPEYPDTESMWNLIYQLKV